MVNFLQINNIFFTIFFTTKRFLIKNKAICLALIIFILFFIDDCQSQDMNSKTAPNAANTPFVPSESGIKSITTLLPSNLADKLTPQAANLLQENKQDSLINQAGNIFGPLTKKKKSFSLMYNDQELDEVQNAIDSFKNDQAYVSPSELAASKDKKEPEPKEVQDNARSYIYLGSIMYFNPTSWVVWVDNKKISFVDNKSSNELYLKSVTSSEIEILWTLSISKWKILSGKKSEDLAPKINAQNQVEVNFTLCPNQTYILNSGNVVEGNSISSSIRQAQLQSAK
jgi:uncharacterized protein YlbG (UPF0298 family)